MSYSPFAYSYPSSSQLLMTGQHPSNASNCCESSPTSPSESHSAVAAHQSAAAAAAVCSALPAAAAAYDSRLLSSYPRLATGLTVNGFYGTSYQDQTSYVTAALGTNPSAFYSSLPTPYMKDSRGGWGSLPQAAACYPYDPSTLAAYGPYGDRYGAIDNAARRKNATRETTNTLKAWLYEHRKNPYPTKGEKIMLAIITKMTLTQVSTWFANARRRLKKENKMTWEPRNKTSDSADGDDKSDNGSGDEDDRPASVDNNKKRNMSDIKQENEEDDTRDSHFKMGCMDSPDNSSGSESRSPSLQCMRAGLRPPSPGCGLPGPGSDRPKIWSLAHTATSDSPPPIRRTSPALRANDPYDVKPEDSYGSSELSLRNVMYREDVKPLMGEMNGVHAKTWMNGCNNNNKSYASVDMGQRCSPPKAAFGPQTTFSERRPSYCDMLGGRGYGVTVDRQPPPPLIRMNYNRDDDDMLQSTAKATNAIGTCATDKPDTGVLSERKLYSSSVSPGPGPVGVPTLPTSLSPSAGMHGAQTAFKPLPARNSCSEPRTV